MAGLTTGGGGVGRERRRWSGCWSGSWSIVGLRLDADAKAGVALLRVPIVVSARFAAELVAAIPLHLGRSAAIADDRWARHPERHPERRMRRRWSGCWSGSWSTVVLWSRRRPWTARNRRVGRHLGWSRRVGGRRAFGGAACCGSGSARRQVARKPNRLTPRTCPRSLNAVTHGLEQHVRRQQHVTRAGFAGTCQEMVPRACLHLSGRHAGSCCFGQKEVPAAVATPTRCGWPNRH